MPTILVVDDEATVLTVVHKALTRAGHTVLTANSGPEALSLCRDRSEPIHLLLTDINMPRMNGIELAECLSTLQPGLPVAFMTGYAMDTPQMKTLLESGRFSRCGIIKKPFTAETLVWEVATFIAAEQARS